MDKTILMRFKMFLLYRIALSLGIWEVLGSWSCGSSNVMRLKGCHNLHQFLVVKVWITAVRTLVKPLTTVLSGLGPSYAVIISLIRSAAIKIVFSYIIFTLCIQNGDCNFLNFKPIIQFKLLGCWTWFTLKLKLATLVILNLHPCFCI